MLNKILRSAASILGILLLWFVIFEAVCRIAGLPQGGSDFTETVIMDARLSIRKPADEIRIFAYGESTMHGAHYGPTSSIPRWAEAYLKDYLPGQKIRMVNFARLGRGSDFIRQTFEETLPYKPDIALFYMGHNDFLPGERMDQIDAVTEPGSHQLKERLKESRFISFLYRTLLRVRMFRDKRKPKDFMGQAVIETEMHNSGLGAPEVLPSDPFYRENIARFKENILEMIRLADKRKIHTLFFKPVSNIKDFPPNQSTHQKDLTPEQLKTWESLYQEGLRHQKNSRLQEALNTFQKAAALDDTFADLNFRMAEIYFHFGQFSEAKRLFEQARDHDTVMVRANKDVRAVFDELAAEGKTEILDPEPLFAHLVPGGIIGSPVIEDNAHFSIEGHALLGKALALKIADKQWLPAPSGWRLDNERSFDAISKSLGITKALQVEAFIKVADYYGRRFKERIAYAEKAAQLDPDNVTALRELGWSYWSAGMPEKAAPVYEKIGKLDPVFLSSLLKAKPDLAKSLQKTPVK